MRGRWAVVAATGALALLGGCGGDDDEGGGLSKAELNEKTGALCKESSRKADAIPEPTNIEDADQAATYFGRIVALADEHVAKLQALEPEESLKPAYDEYLVAAEATRAFFKGILAKAQAKDPSGLQDLQQEAETGTLEKRNEDAARKAGLTICAENDTTTTAQAKTHEISVRYDPPQTQTERVAQELLKLGGTDGVAAGFSKNFAFPVDVTIHVHGGEEGSPNYDPSTKTVNLYYSFVDQTGAIIRRGQPNIADREFGKQLAAVDAFILVHELGHMFVDVFEIPITGREEDAVDGMATTFFTDAVPNGLEYAFDAARFFKELQEVQGAPDVHQFQDEHGLSIQRAYDIVCSVAGATQKSMQRIAQLQILSPRRLQRCPAEHRQKSRAWTTLLRPHLRKNQ